MNAIACPVATLLLCLLAADDQQKLPTAEDFATGPVAPGAEVSDAWIEEHFGEAAGKMREFFHVAHNPGDNPLSRDRLGRLYLTLSQAGAATADLDAWQRIDDLTLYVRYLDQYRDYLLESGRERQSQFEQMLQTAWRARESGLIDVERLWTTVPAADEQIEMADNMKWDVPAEQNPMKRGTSWPRHVLDVFLQEGTARHRGYIGKDE